MELRVAIFVFVISVTNVFTEPVYSQVTKLSLDLNNKSLEQVMDEIENQTGFYFVLNQKQIDISRNVSIQAKDKLITDILQELFNGTNVNYVIFDKKILLTTDPIENNLLAIATESYQQQQLAGTVIDAVSEEPLPGVNVVVEGTLIGTVTDSNGKYYLQTPSQNAVLIFSFIGYQTEEVTYTGQNSIDVIMVSTLQNLEEIIVTGYSVERKKDIIGSVSVVNTDEMKSIASGNVLNQMQGRVSGLTIATDASVGGASKVRVRGFGSFSGSDPLYIIDGVPGSIDLLNSNDIQSLQVLKDAASASVYGARAANGVVIITTKQGQIGANKVNIDYYNGINFADSRSFPELCSVEEMGQLAFQQMTGAGRKYGDANWSDVIYGNGPEPIIPEYILVNDHGSRTNGATLARLQASDPAAFAVAVDPVNYNFQTHQIVKASLPGTDWGDEVYNPAPIQNLQVATSGGSDKGNYVVSLGYFNQKSISNKYTYFTRYTLRTNTSLNLKSWLKVGENLQVTYQPGHSGENSVNAWRTLAICPVWDIMGNPSGSSIPGVISTAGGNPVADNWRGRFDGYNNYGVFGNSFVDLTPIKDLVIHSSFGIDYSSNRSKFFQQTTYEYAQNIGPPNYLTWTSGDFEAWTFTNTATYGKTFGSHVFKILLGTEANNTFSRTQTALRQALLIETDPNFQTLSAATGTMINSGSFSRSRLWSQFGRFDYTYADKYMVNFTLRRDGSSKFSEANRFGLFPAAAIGWRVTSEDFMAGLTWLNDLKLRASYGVIGNQTGLAVDNQFTTYTRTINEAYSIQGTNNSITQSFTPSRLGDPNARWEKSITTNLGFDASLFDGSTSVTFDWFNKETKDLLVTNQPPYTAANITQPMINVGTIRNRGVDFTVTQRGNIAGQVDFEVSANFSAYKNKVLKILDNPLATLAGGSTNLTKVGYPIAFFYGYLIDGFVNTQEELDAYKASVNNTIIPPQIGRWKLKDVNGDGIINDLDRTYMGSPHPKYQIGLTFSFGYKGFDLNGFLFLNYGNQIYNSFLNDTDFNRLTLNRSKRMLYESWTPELGNDAKLPKLDINDVVSNKYTTSYNIQDGSYLQLKQLQLGYTLPTNMTAKIKIDKLRVYTQVQNLFTLDRFNGMDPGQNISGSSDLTMGTSGNTPIPMQVIFGINLGF